MKISCRSVHPLTSPDERECRSFSLVFPPARRLLQTRPRRISGRADDLSSSFVGAAAPSAPRRDREQERERTAIGAKKGEAACLLPYALILFSIIPVRVGVVTGRPSEGPAQPLSRSPAPRHLFAHVANILADAKRLKDTMDSSTRATFTLLSVDQPARSAAAAPPFLRRGATACRP